MGTRCLWDADTDNYASGQTFTTFTTYKWTQKARVLHKFKLESLTGDKHFNLMGPFTSVKENEVNEALFFLHNLQVGPKS
jgi:hypothetical protein